jgi:hypothetical protein
MKGASPWPGACTRQRPLKSLKRRAWGPSDSCILRAPVFDRRICPGGCQLERLATGKSMGVGRGFNRGRISKSLIPLGP